ncbi:MAG: hypothetical protein JNK33_00875 [Candidatus Doudnabacteria bacterium]|nr:hypothetical protein [Candidatus Doudnabacteria bacterium]
MYIKLGKEIKIVYLLGGIGLAILLGLLLAYLLAPRLFTGQSIVIEDTATVYKLPDSEAPQKPKLAPNPNK